MRFGNRLRAPGAMVARSAAAIPGGPQLSAAHIRFRRTQQEVQRGLGGLAAFQKGTPRRNRPRGRTGRRLRRAGLRTGMRTARPMRCSHIVRSHRRSRPHDRMTPRVQISPGGRIAILRPKPERQQPTRCSWRCGAQFCKSFLPESKPGKPSCQGKPHLILPGARIEAFPLGEIDGDEPVIFRALGQGVEQPFCSLLHLAGPATGRQVA